MRTRVKHIISTIKYITKRNGRDKKRFCVETTTSAIIVLQLTLSLPSFSRKMGRRDRACSFSLQFATPTGGCRW